LDKRNFTIPEERSKFIAKGIAEGLTDLHSSGVVHRDIKLENILMTNTSDSSIPKLTDFGLSAMIGPG
jgi:serine/threonine protein kinase